MHSETRYPCSTQVIDRSAILSQRDDTLIGSVQSILLPQPFGLWLEAQKRNSRIFQRSFHHGYSPKSRILRLFLKSANTFYVNWPSNHKISFNLQLHQNVEELDSENVHCLSSLLFRSTAVNARISCHVIVDSSFTIGPAQWNTLPLFAH